MKRRQFIRLLGGGAVLPLPFAAPLIMFSWFGASPRLEFLSTPIVGPFDCSISSSHSNLFPS
jgi:hypothetical protein